MKTDLFPSIMVGKLRIRERLSSIFRPYYSRFYFSQDGEDAILLSFFGNKADGFYLDIGAHHPLRFSNTYLFYQQGWRGINIDANPGSMKDFEKIRPRDINLELAISSKGKELDFYMLNEPALNTFSKSLASEREQNPAYHLLEVRSIPCRTLTETLDEFLPEGQIIDFLNVDVEGHEYEVLSSNDWGRFRPNVIIVEELDESGLMDMEKTNPVRQLLIKNDYRFVAKTLRCSFFRSESICR